MIATTINRSRLPAALIVGVLFAGLLASATASRAATGDPVLINEALVSHTGTDTAEYVELFGTPGTPLAGVSLVVVEGDGAPQVPGTVSFRHDFGAADRVGGNGFYLIGNPLGLGNVYHVVPNVAIGQDSFQNGSETFALLPTSQAPAVGAVVTGSEAPFDTVAFSDGGPADQFYFSAPVLGPDPDTGFFPAGGRRVADGVDTDTVDDWTFADFALGLSNTPTPGTAFNTPVSVTCPSDVTTTEGTAASASVSASDPDGAVTTFTVGVTPDPGTISAGSVTPAPGPGGVATAAIDASPATPAGTYAVAVTAGNADPSPQVATCTFNIVVDPAPPPPPPPPPAGVTLDQLVGMAADFTVSGDVAPAKAHLLEDRLDRAARFLAAGKDAAYRAQLRAFAKQVEGLAPRWVEQDAADAMAALARGLMKV